MRTWGITWLLLVAALPACTGLGNALIGAHGNSMRDTSKASTNGNGGLSLEMKKGGTAVALSAAPVIAIVKELVVEGLKKAVEVESKRYDATYSARGAALLYTKTGTTVTPEVDGLTLTRWVNVTEDGQEKQVKALEFDLAMEISQDGSALKLNPQAFELRYAQGKVAFPSIFPWHWVSSILWAPWFVADPTIADVDVSIQVRLEAIAQDKKGAVKTIDLGAVEFPMGKSRIYDLPQKRGANQFGGAGPLWVPLPALDGDCRLPINVTVTVVESNDLGDVIAHAEALLDKAEGGREGDASRGGSGRGDAGRPSGGRSGGGRLDGRGGRGGR